MEALDGSYHMHNEGYILTPNEMRFLSHQEAVEFIKEMLNGMKSSFLKSEILSLHPDDVFVKTGTATKPGLHRLLDSIESKTPNVALERELFDEIYGTHDFARELIKYLADYFHREPLTQKSLYTAFNNLLIQSWLSFADDGSLDEIKKQRIRVYSYWKLLNILIDTLSNKEYIQSRTAVN